MRCEMFHRTSFHTTSFYRQLTRIILQLASTLPTMSILLLSMMQGLFELLCDISSDFGSAPNEPRYEKTNILHMRKQRRRSASR